MQKYALSTRLGIPVMFHEEALHGLAHAAIDTRRPLAWWRRWARQGAAGPAAVPFVRRTAPYAVAALAAGAIVSLRHVMGVPPGWAMLR